MKEHDMSSQPGILQRLDLEWERVAQGPAARRALRRCTATAPELAAFGSLTALVEKVNERGHPEESDAVLLALLRVAPTDDLAARSVLQAMMPAVKNLTAKFTPCGAWSSEETAAVVVAAMWERIRRYPVDRRPRKVSANLSLDTRQTVWRTGHKLVHGHLPRPKAA
jgi:hypothetical protein